MITKIKNQELFTQKCLINGIWCEIIVSTQSGRGNKPAAVKEFKKFDNTIIDKDVYSQSFEIFSLFGHHQRDKINTTRQK